MSLSSARETMLAKGRGKVHFSRAISVDTLQLFNLGVEELWNLVATFTLEEAILKLPFDRQPPAGPRTASAFYLAVHRLTHDDPPDVLQRPPARSTTSTT
jgi:hypothetical protein